MAEEAQITTRIPTIRSADPTAVSNSMARAVVVTADRKSTVPAAGATEEAGRRKVAMARGVMVVVDSRRAMDLAVAMAVQMSMDQVVVVVAMEDGGRKVAMAPLVDMVEVKAGMAHLAVAVAVAVMAALNTQAAATKGPVVPRAMAAAAGTEKRDAKAMVVVEEADTAVEMSIARGVVGDTEKVRGGTERVRSNMVEIADMERAVGMVNLVVTGRGGNMEMIIRSWDDRADRRNQAWEVVGVAHDK